MGKRHKPVAPIQQLALFDIELAPVKSSSTPPPMVYKEVHHHMKVWFRDYRPSIIFCTASLDRPTFTNDELWSSQLLGRCGYYYEDCCLCNPSYDGLIPDYLERTE